MNLPFFKRPDPKTPREYLFALEIDHHLVKSSIWSVVNNKPQVLTVGINASWDDKSEESLIQACDHSLTDCTNRIDQSGKISPEKVILGLPSDWVTDEKIQTDKLRLLKAISTQLSLTVVGFVVTAEAVIDHIQKLDGVPPTAILIGLSPHTLEISLVRLGKSEGTQVVVRSSKVAQDLVEGLSRFTNVDMLPSRMLVYDSTSDLEEIRQRLLAHPWQSPQTKLPFLHFPKIENLSSDFSISAIAISGGLEVAQATGLLSESSPTSSVESAVSSPEPITTTVEASPHHIPTPSDLGFEFDTDLAETVMSASENTEENTVPQLDKMPDVEETFKSKSQSKFSFRLPKFSNWQFPPLPKFNYSIGLLVIFLIVVTLLGVGYWYLPTAKVDITIQPETIAHEFVLSTSNQITSIDLTNLQIPTSVVDASISDEKSVPTTGSKLIGDKATGEVSIINGTSQTKSFPSGTVLSSPSGLKFLIQSEVNVASASGSADPNSYQPGKATVKVTADQIGTESNLSAGTQFKIGTFSSLDFIAKNESAFSGGSSRSVKAVSKSDVTQLKQSLSDSIKSRMLDSLSEKVTSDQLIIPESISTQVTTETFDHKQDETADNLSLKLELKATALTISKSDLVQAVSEQIKSQIPSGYTLSEDIDYKFQLKSKDSQTTQLTIQSTASLLPSLDTEKIKTSLVGKYPQSAVEYIKTLPGVSRVDISFPIPLPKFLLTLPRVSSHITVSVSR